MRAALQIARGWHVANSVPEVAKYLTRIVGQPVLLTLDVPWRVIEKSEKPMEWGPRMKGWTMAK